LLRGADILLNLTAAAAKLATTVLTLEELARSPLVTYVFSFSGPSSLSDAFAHAGLNSRIALTARDSDVVKTYVCLGLGVAIIALALLSPLLWLGVGCSGRLIGFS
jgi:DNA-binding transcriptional LysR family regulator